MLTPVMKTAVLGKSAAAASNPGGSLLATMVGWWDALTYSGSGNLLNKGTAGASGDMVPAGGSASPTFSTNHFVFDGVNDFMSNATDIASFDIPNKGTTFTAGIVINMPNTPNNGANYFCKGNGPGWAIFGNGTLFGTKAFVNDSSYYIATGPVGTQNVKALHLMQVTTTQVIAALNNTQGTPITDGRTGSADSSQVLLLGQNGGGVCQKMDLYGAFVHRGALTAQNITDIGTYYGLTI
jgi:hypothetical protein